MQSHFSSFLKTNLESFHSDFDAGDVLTFIRKQYVVPGIFEPQDGDIIFDIGSYNGATAIFFSQFIGNNGKVYSFDPLPEYFEISKSNTSQYRNIECLNFGFSNKEGRFTFNNNNACAQIDDLGSVQCELNTIDKFVRDNKIEVYMIKMDIEGAELRALYGGIKTIKQYKPKLAICIYHNGGEDMVTIPLALKRLNMGYKFYIRKYHISIQETVLFAL